MAKVNKVKKFRLILLVFLLLPVANLLAADIPMIMNYQGSVTDATGSPLNGSGYFKFAIVDAAGTTTFWVNDNVTTNGTEPTTSVIIPVTNGLFSVKLGDVNLTNMAALNVEVFVDTNVYLRVWFSFDGLNFEQFTPDTQIVSTGFAFKAQQANAVADGVVTSNSIQDNSISNADISDAAAISAIKIDSTGLDADTVDGLEATDFAASVHAHGDIDATTLDGLDSLDFSLSTHGHITLDADTVDGFHASDFAIVIHGHDHGALTGIGSSDHHVKTTNFTDMVGQISDEQIPDTITRVTDADAKYVAQSGGTITGPLTVNTGPLTVNTNIDVQSLSYQVPKIQYLMLAGGQCVGPPDGTSRQAFYCPISNTVTGYWSVNVPHEANLIDMQVHLSTNVGSTTTCNLSTGAFEEGTVLVTVTDNNVSTAWHWTAEEPINQVVNTQENAYAVTCSNTLDSLVGAIRIRYSISAP